MFVVVGSALGGGLGRRLWRIACARLALGLNLPGTWAAGCVLGLAIRLHADGCGGRPVPLSRACWPHYYDAF